MKSHILVFLAFILAITAGKSLSSQVNLNQGLVAYYPFNGNANDVSGNGNNGIVFGATLTQGQAGFPNTAYYFNGSNNYIDVNGSLSLNSFPNDSFSLYALVKVKGFYGGTCHGNCVIEKGDADFIPGHYSLRFSDAFSTSFANCSSPVNPIEQNYCLQVYGSNNTSYQQLTPYIDTSQWDCVIATFDGDSARIYVNSILRDVQPITASLSSNNNHLFLGHKNSLSYPYWFHGIMDEIRIYNRVLNEQEIDTLCNLFTLPLPISINHYAAVSSYNPCNNALTVDSANGFSIGDTVLLVQMKGSDIDSSNTMLFGDVLNYNHCGNYEVNTIQNISGSMITLQNTLTRTYNFVQGKVQLVSIPTYNNYNVSVPHTCMPWNGSKGGVFAINVLNNLTIQDEINVTGRGFTGGISNIQNSTLTNCNQFQFFDAPNVDNSAAKGEGITSISINKSYARGKLANAGGGGNGHNGGGGGGSNAGSGGIGGSQYYSCNISPLPNTTGGVGGTQLVYSNVANKIFLGGGGGAGHSNNYSSNFPPQNLHTSDGAPGGGLVFIMAGNILSNGGSIKSNGMNGYNCLNNNLSGVCHDGMGGGGAGGTILINTTGITGNLPIECKGGNGGNVSAASSLNPLGPGGGGSGGVLWLNMATIPANVIANYTGGSHGVCTNSGNIAWGATDGNSGNTLTTLNIPIDTIPFQPPTGFITTGQNIQICSGQTAQLMAFGGVSYTWTNASTLSNSSIPNPLATPVTTTTYTVTGTNSNGCTSTATQTVNVIAPPIIGAFATPPSICIGGNTTLNGTGGISYSWSGGIQNGTPFNPSTTTTYTVTGTSANGCSATNTITVVVNPSPNILANASPSQVCAGSSCTLTGSGGQTYVWTGGVNNGIPFFPTSSGIYTVTGTDANGCTSTSSIQISVIPIPIITSQASPSSVCAGSPTTFIANGANTYQWSGGIQNNIPFTPSTSGTYTVIGTDANGCTASTTQNITVNPLPLVTATAIPNSVCSNNPTTLYGGGAVTYSWSQGILNGVAFVPATSTVYTVVGTDANNCINTSTVNVIVYTQVPIGIINNEPQICAGDSCILTATGGNTYVWQPAAFLDDTIGTNVWAIPIGVTQYTVTGVDISGCSGTATTLVSTIPPVHVNATKSNDIICGKHSSQLFASGAEHFIWTPSTGLNNDTISNPISTITQSTTYIVTGNTGACFDSDTITVDYFTSELEFVQVPSAFTPNGDGLNDCLHILHNVPLNKYYFTVFNRWGEKVYESEDPNECWDGSIKNGEHSLGTYYYYLKSTSICGDIFLKGDITVIR